MDYDGFDRTVDVHIKRIRENLGHLPGFKVVTVRGLGYKVEVEWWNLFMASWFADFLITIAFSFSVAGYVALRNNYDQIEDMAKSELSATSEYVVGILNSLDDANINDIMNKYAISSEVYITLYSPELDYYTYGENKGYFS